MRYTQLGGTGLRVSVLAYSVYGTGGPYRGLTRREATELVREAWSLGINFYVTAPVYGRDALEILREGLGSSIGDAVIGVLIGYKKGGGQSFEPEFLVEAMEEACDALGKCPLELAILHDPGLELLRRPEIYEAADTLREENLALHIAVSISQDPDALASAREALKREQVEALRFIYNMLEQEPGATIADMARKRGKGIIVAMPHAGGLLLGEGPESWEHLDPYYAGGKRIRGWYRSALALYEFMKAELREELTGLLEEMTPAQLALRFIYSSIPVDTVEAAARSRKKLRELAEAAEKPELPRATVERLKGLYRGRALPA